MRYISPCAFLALSLAAGTATATEDWPEFRGPGGQGHAESAGLPVTWGAGENISWQTPVPGAGLSSPILHHEVLYLTTALLDDTGQPKSLRLLAFDPESGEPMWNREVFEVFVPQPKHQKNSHASPTPVAEGERIYVHFGPMGTAAVDLNGEVVWRQESLDYPPLHGNGGSPIIVGDKLIFNCDGEEDPFIVALNKTDGSIAWRVPRVTNAGYKFSFSTPLLVEVQGQPQVISPGSGMVAGYDPADGLELWRVNYGDGFSVVPRPVEAHGHVYISTGFTRPSVYAIKLGGTGDVTDSHLTWQVGRSAPTTPSLIVVGSEVYFVSDGGIASCVDALTGVTHWNERLGGDFSASPLHANGLIYFTNERGVTYVVKAETTFEVVAENDLGEDTLASLAVGGDAIFQRSTEHLYRIQSTTGE